MTESSVVSSVPSPASTYLIGSRTTSPERRNLAELAGLSKGYVYRLTPTGTKALREIADVDCMDSPREIVVFMRGPKPARRNNLEELLADLNPEANLPHGQVDERVV